MALEIAIKVDVCNHRALHRGLPDLLATLDRAGVPASFFVSFGPDHSGRAVRRLLRPGFAAKMLRTRAPRMYGFRTLFYGTLLPAPGVGESAPELLRSLADRGHDVGLHGFDHVGWQDGLAGMGPAAIRASCARAVELFEKTLGAAPRFSGAPGWQVTPISLAIQEEFGLDWASDCRDGAPFFPVLAGGRRATLQIPTTAPTSDELLASGASPADLAERTTQSLREDALNVVGLHAEAEGIHYAAWLRAWLADLQGRGVRFVRLSDVALREGDRAPTRRVVRRRIPGRVGAVACPEEAP